MLKKLARGVDGLDFGVSGSRLLLSPTGSGVAFICCIQSRIVFGFRVCWKKRWWLFVLITFIRSQTGVGLLVSSCPGTGSGADSDSRFAKQDWIREQKISVPTQWCHFWCFYIRSDIFQGNFWCVMFWPQVSYWLGICLLSIITPLLLEWKDLDS